MQQLANWLTLAAPALRWMRRALVQSLEDLRQPQRRTTRGLLLAGMGVFLFVALAHGPARN